MIEGVPARQGAVLCLYGKNEQITRAEQIRSYNPAKYGLYYSSVGEDVLKNDILENIETYKAREKRLLEEEKLLKEQQKKEEQERLPAQAQSNMSSADPDKSNSLQAQAKQKTAPYILPISVVIITVIILVLSAKHLIKKNSKR